MSKLQVVSLNNCTDGNHEIEAVKPYNDNCTALKLKGIAKAFVTGLPSFADASAGQTVTISNGYASIKTSRASKTFEF